MADVLRGPESSPTIWHFSRKVNEIGKQDDTQKEMSLKGNTVNHRSVKRKSRSDADLIQRGRTKVKIHNSNVAPDNVDEFYLIV